MVTEFAIDPKLLYTWTKRSLFSIFVREFGLGTPRAMSGYPSGSSWKRLAIQNARSKGASATELTRLAELIKLLEENKIPRSESSYNIGLDWLDQAVFEHKNNRFHAILTKENPNYQHDVIAGDVDEVLSHDLWFIETRELCKRNADDIVKVVGEMLRLSRTVIFIDPYFHPGSQRYKNSVTPLLESLCCKGARACSRIEILTNDNESSISTRSFSQIFQDEMPSLIPEGMKVTLRRLRDIQGGEKLHDRFILTELGGVTISVGLDQGDKGQHTQVFLMSKKQYLHWWSLVKGSGFGFSSIGDPVTVTGQMITIVD